MSACEVDFCNRESAVKAKNAGIKVCKGHYQQDYNKGEFTPFRTYKDAPQDAQGRVCTGCEEYKPWDDYYDRTNNVTPKQARCKVCMVKEEVERQAARRALGIPCNINGCDEAAQVKGMCLHHYGKDYWERRKAK